MKASAGTRRASFEPTGVLNVAAIYEEFAAGIRLKEALFSLGRNLGFVRIINKAWSFSMLERLDVRAAAVREAADADLLIVVATGDQSLPVQITRWLERCLVESNSAPAALVELHDDILDQNGSPIALISELVKIARRWQMDFITNSQFDDWLNAEYVRRIIRQSEQRFHFSDPSPFRNAKVANVASQPQRESLAV